ncbi:MAG: hypothetical protein NTY12_02490 [Candidatus Falkowbacteria bacterium]|nr:hypothetical protein [Candidatus Falkowbacteria bacterium]
MDNPKMTDKRWAEIAQIAIGYLLGKLGIELSHDSSRELKNLAKKLEIPFEELQYFARPFIQEMLDKTYGKEKN